jgi:general secretion pathway protein F
MAVFAYRGFSSGGRPVSGVVDADNARTARAKLRSQGVFPTEITEEEGRQAVSVSIRKWMPSLGGRKMKPTELSLMTRQLSSLLGAGVQLVDAIGTLSDQSSRPMVKKMLSQVRERVREGSSLADALAAHRDVFSDLYIGMVRSGEAAAALEAVLDRLADYNERQAEFIAKVRGAMTYPIIMMAVGTAIMGFLVVYVVPKVAGVFQENHAALPFATLLLIGVSDFIINYWYAMLAITIGLVAGISFALSTPKGRRFYDKTVLKLPYIGPTVIRVICARFARTLGTLLSSGVQLMPALEAVKGIVTNGLLRDAVEDSRESIREGHGMGDTLKRSGLFPPLLVEMVKVGERSGELERMLDRVADSYEREVENSLAQMATVLEPVMTLVMAGGILFMMMAVLMPIMQLNQLMQ